MRSSSRSTGESRPVSATRHIGGDERILHPATDDPDEIERLAELVLPG
ncbi:hypothetical protein [Paractinoplanes abujensis]|uniref:Uncharacterized protein n=1 Tax=Paractinoplanes abujensis TaxID=882441 RepID=A0A7W7CQB9_9ACTN|nr:hypothetical protein [Actinoplanes abujensis]MBB4692775.1 hypothetical protein [Actinoplanes abujensis]